MGHANCLPLSAHHKHTLHTHTHTDKNNEADATHARTERAARRKTREERRDASRELQKQHPGGFDCEDSVEASAAAAATAAIAIAAAAAAVTGQAYVLEQRRRQFHTYSAPTLTAAALSMPLLGFCGNFKYKLHCFYGYKCLFVIFLSLLLLLLLLLPNDSLYKGLNDVDVASLRDIRTDSILTVSGNVNPQYPNAIASRCGSLYVCDCVCV